MPSGNPRESGKIRFLFAKIIAHIDQLMPVEILNIPLLCLLLPANMFLICCEYVITDMYARGRYDVAEVLLMQTQAVVCSLCRHTRAGASPMLV